MPKIQPKFYRKKKEAFYLMFNEISAPISVKIVKNKKKPIKSGKNSGNRENFLQFCTPFKILYTFCTQFAKGLKILTGAKNPYIWQPYLRSVYYTGILVICISYLIGTENEK